MIMSTSIPVLPYNISANSTVDVSFKTAVNESESGIAGRKSLWGQPIRMFNLTIGPDQVSEVYSILLACLGSRWPLALRDWANYKLVNVPQTNFAVVNNKTVVTLGYRVAPATGTRSFTQRILVPDDDFAISINGAPIVASFEIAGGILTINQILSPGYDVITLNGSFLTPVTISGDTLTITWHTQETFSIQGLQLREILEDEYNELTNTEVTAWM